MPMNVRKIDPPAPGVAFVWIDSATGWVKCRSPFNSEFIALLKTMIPAQDRKWIKTERVWSVKFEQRDMLIDVVGKYYAVRELKVSPEKFVGSDEVRKRTAKVRESLGRKKKRMDSEGVPDEMKARRIVIDENEIQEDFIRASGRQGLALVIFKIFGNSHGLDGLMLQVQVVGEIRHQDSFLEVYGDESFTQTML